MFGLGVNSGKHDIKGITNDYQLSQSINQSINVYLPNTNISDNINVDNIKYGAPWEQCQKKEIIK